MERIVYKAPNNPGQKMPDVFIVTEPGMAVKYRAQKAPIGYSKKSNDENQSSLALVDVVQSFDIFQTATGKGFEGPVARPAKSDLDAIFGTENEQEIIEKIILEGELQGARTA
ncbi:hypothetical protein BC939DRAFT_446435 [Gamsiella multidivaricata]|uniref:uncharacterized protein n=1 Tax=Gamsiella multidivaricata TaxID=101098 RepID=UPI002220D65B|nr:uncharacterized protein BC939DRAFT_446435 [Gamsiella multidivaricata]KAG0350243.1 hypothetical protein BGZ54_003942 [Gamsiella multidivaricata]KAI7826987.1 hypothetical protein BC939DRAFT_446435 [Gamsiella multidivaricata]